MLSTMPSSAITNAIDNAIIYAITSAIAIDILCNGLYVYGAI